MTAPGTEAAEFSAAVVGDAGREDAAAASGAPDAPGAAPAARNGQTVDPAGPIDPAEGSTDEAAGAPIATPPPTIDSGKAGAAES